MTHLLMQYSYLQMLDLLTTVAFLVNGVREANPFVLWALEAAPTPLSGLVGVKVVAICLGLYCWRMGRSKLLSGINVFFAAVVTWNMVALIVSAVERTS